VVAGGREGRGLEGFGADAELLKEGAVQSPLHDHGHLGAFGELHQAIRIRGLGGGQRQRAPEADEVMRVLGDVVLEALKGMVRMVS
jgi:hypothetical protein